MAQVKFNNEYAGVYDICFGSNEHPRNIHNCCPSFGSSFEGDLDLEFFSNLQQIIICNLYKLNDVINIDISKNEKFNKIVITESNDMNKNQLCFKVKEIQLDRIIVSYKVLHNNAYLPKLESLRKQPFIPY
ncbi:11131_t:CDS:1, partial [Racocetra persica]